MTQYFLILKACSHRVSVHCMCDVLSNKSFEKGYDKTFLGMISKIKTTRHTSGLQQE